MGAALLATACSGTDGDTATGSGSSTTSTTTALEPVDGGDLTVAISSQADSWNPIGGRWSYDGHVVGSTMFDTLAVERGDGNLDMGLAESIDPNDDATEWTIVTKEGITFHDGTPFDAEVVEANFEARLESPLTAISMEPVDSIGVLDDRTVVVTMNRPWSGFGHALAAQSGYMVSLASTADPTAAPVGTGPFIFDEAVTDSHVTVKKNPDYWQEPAHLDSIRFSIVAEPNSRMTGIEAGDFDSILMNGPAEIAELLEMGDVNTLLDGSEPDFVMLNTLVPPLDDARVREALVLGTDRDTVIRAIGGEGIVEPADSVFVSYNPWHLDDAGYPDADSVRAAELVAEYEAETGTEVEFTLGGVPGPLALPVGTTLQEQWANIGIDIEVEQVETASFINEVVVGNYEAALFRAYGWIDPDFSYIFWHSDNANGLGEVSINFTQMDNPALDEALETGRADLDPDVRAEAYDDVQRIINEESTHILLWEALWALASADDVHGFDEAAERGFARPDYKSFWNDVWIEP